MKRRYCAFFAILFFLIIGAALATAQPDAPESECPPGSGQDSSGICLDTGPTNLLTGDSGTNVLQQPLRTEEDGSRVRASAAKNRPPRDSREGTAVVYLFWGIGCPHCEAEKKFLAELKQTSPGLEIRDYEVLYTSRNRELLSALLKTHGMQASGVPITFIGRQVFRGFSVQTKETIERAIAECRGKGCPDALALLKDAGKYQIAAQPAGGHAAAGGEKGLLVDIPLLGALDARSTSLPMLTLVIAGMDSFNPCAFFVLLSLLGLLIHARSRNKMMLVGGVFVFFSGFIYFLFMAAWLNLFLVMGNVPVITRIAGVVSLFIAAINIKDFFVFKKGVSLSIPDSAKPRLFDRMRKLLRSTSLFSILAGTTVLAVMANSYELLCTAGFPMVFTRILTLNQLSTTSYYLYLAFYNIIYVVPLFIIVLMFTITLGGRKLSEWQGRTLKLVSGTMMLGLGAVLLIKPALLNSVVISFLLLAGALAASLAVAALTRKLAAGRLGETGAGSSR